VEIASVLAIVAEVEGLQWGHVFVDVEICPSGRRCPQRLGLQWGHVFVDVEMTAVPVTPIVSSNVLQWGHVFVDVEIQEIFEKFRGVARLQWGHVFVDVEIPILHDGADGDPGCFNGATSL